MLSSLIRTRTAKGRVPPKRNVKLWSSTIQGGGFTKTTPLIVKYIHKGNTHYLMEKQWLKIKFTIRRQHLSIGGVGELWWRTTLLHFFLGGPFPNCLYILKHVYFMSLKNKDITLTCIKIAFTCRVFKKSEICGSYASKI